VALCRECEFLWSKKKKIDAIGVDNYENWEYKKSVRTSVHRRGRNDARKKHMRKRWRKDKGIWRGRVDKVRAARQISETGAPSTWQRLPWVSDPPPSQWRVSFQPGQHYGNAMRSVRRRCWSVPPGYVYCRQSTRLRRILLSGAGHGYAGTTTLAGGRCRNWAR